MSTPGTPPPPALPGRDLALFLVLLVSVDLSGLLHIYSLSSLYGEALFLGLGALVTLVALGLLMPNCGLRIADLGLRRAIRIPQSAIRNPQWVVGAGLTLV